MDTFDEDADPIVQRLREAAQRAEEDDRVPPFDPAWFETLSEGANHAIGCLWFRRHAPERCRRREPRS